MQLDMTKWAQMTHQLHPASLIQQATPAKYEEFLMWQTIQAISQLVQPTADKAEVITAARGVISAFCQLANHHKNVYLLLIDDDQINKWQQLWHTQSFAKVGLIATQQLLNYHFKHQERGFCVAWHLVVKYMLCELKLSPTVLQAK